MAKATTKKHTNYSLNALTSGYRRRIVPDVRADDTYPMDLYAIKKDEEGGFCVRAGTKKNQWYIWEHCRDAVHHEYHHADFFYCAGNEENAANTIAFVRRIERKLKLKENRKAAFRSTDHPGIIHVSLSKWWSTDLRRSVFTALLRAGKNYNQNKDNWRATLMKSWYFSTTKDAINRFLEGYTRLRFLKEPHDYFMYDPFFEGWVDHFQHMGKEEIKESLVKGNT